MDKHKITNVFKVVLQVAPLVLVVIMGVMYLLYFRNVTVDDLVNFTPENVYIAILVILGMFALKSLSFFFPMLLIIVASGIIFPLWLAIPVNIIGVFIQINIPYLFGVWVERDFVQKLIGKYTKVQKIEKYRSENELFLSFFLRVINVAPCDVTSLLLGSVNTTYVKYIIGSMIGILPGIIFSTTAAASFTDPTSPVFIISVSGDIAFSLIALVGYAIYKKVKKKKA